MVEQHNRLLMTNHEGRPIGTTPFLKLNVTTYDHIEQTCRLGHVGGSEICKNIFFHHSWKNMKNDENTKGVKRNKTIENIFYTLTWKETLITITEI